MVWQAVTDMRFSLIGGYALIPGAGGTPSLFPSSLQPPSVQQFLINEAGGVPFSASAPVADDDNLARDVRHFVLRYRVGVVLVDRATRRSAQVDRLMTRALGMAPVVGGGMDAWYDVQSAPALREPDS